MFVGIHIRSVGTPVPTCARIPLRVDLLPDTVYVARNEAFTRNRIHTDRRLTAVGRIKKNVRGVPTDKPTGAEPPRVYKLDVWE